MKLSQVIKAGKSAREGVELFPGTPGLPSPKDIRARFQELTGLPDIEQVENKAIEFCEHIESSGVIGFLKLD